ncbi:MAG: hypothetical protein AB7E72_01230 [Lysobacterales bacterium]
MLNVGQGSGNFVEILEDGDLKTTVLIDLGSEGASSAHHGPSVDKIVEILEDMDNPEIACLCLSHSDTDHISMIEQLLKQFYKPGSGKPDNQILTIRHVRYGGAYELYQKGSRANVIDQVKAYMPKGSKPTGVTINCSSYVKSKNPIYEDKTLGFALRLLIGNTVRSAVASGNDTTLLPLKDAVMVNTVSLIVVFDWSGSQFITTGDATGITMVRANSIMKDGVGSFFKDPLMLTIPHHGSFRTAFSFTGQGFRGFKKQLAQLTQFARRCGARMLTASAGHNSQFDHPSAYVLDIFWKFTDATIDPYTDPAASNGHFYTAYFKKSYSFDVTIDGDNEKWPTGGDGFYTMQSPVQIYSTVYFDRSEYNGIPPLSGGKPPKKKKKTLPMMVVLPASVAAPSPGFLTDPPATKDFPAEEVGWTFAVTSDEFTVSRIDSDLASRARLMAIVSHAEREFQADAASAASTSPPSAPPVRLSQLRPPRPTPRPPPPGPGPRPKRN